jgi:hypothetical protein
MWFANCSESGQEHVMTDLSNIVKRHDHDGWRDVVFIATAVLLTALSIGATTSKGVGKPPTHTWTLTVIDPVTQLEMR